MLELDKKQVSQVREKACRSYWITSRLGCRTCLFFSHKNFKMATVKQIEVSRSAPEERLTMKIKIEMPTSLLENLEKNVLTTISTWTFEEEGPFATKEIQLRLLMTRQDDIQEEHSEEFKNLCVFLSNLSEFPLTMWEGGSLELLRLGMDNCTLIHSLNGSHERLLAQKNNSVPSPGKSL